MTKPKFQKRTLFLFAYIVFALLPIYWMVNMSFKTNSEISAGFSLFPQNFTWANYKTILTDPAWYSGYINSLIYVTINTVISLAVSLPAAYAFSRYRFLGDKHVFFWLLTNRMTPPAVFLLPFVFFLWRGWIEPGLRLRLWVIFAAGAGLGAVGWWMVASGLSVRTDVSHLRLAAHLLTALLTLGGIVWTALDLAALGKFAGLSVKVRHNPLRPMMPLTFRLMSVAAIEIEIFAAYAAFRSR
jgi:ABC-type spermidine/putrescine transport system permease subunit II